MPKSLRDMTPPAEPHAASQRSGSWQRPRLRPRPPGLAPVVTMQPSTPGTRIMPVMTCEEDPLHLPLCLGHLLMGTCNAMHLHAVHAPTTDPGWQYGISRGTCNAMTL